jgi:phosphoglycolate phosphatase
MKGFLFDLDGTLVDTAVDMLAALKQLAEENGISIEPGYHQYKELVTFGSRALVTSIFGQQDDVVFKKLQTRYLAIYGNKLAIESQLFEGIDTVINQLDCNHIPWGVVTNKPAYLAKPLISALPQLQQCKIIIGGGCTNHSKPHPEPINHAIKKIGIDPQTSWYIGDALSDIQAANAAHMKSAVANWGYLRKQDQPETWQADIILTNPLEILGL